MLLMKKNSQYLVVNCSRLLQHVRYKFIRVITKKMALLPGSQLFAEGTPARRLHDIASGFAACYNEKFRNFLRMELNTFEELFKLTEPAFMF